MALEFEDILPFVEGDGDTGRTAREKINRNFTKIKPIANVGAEMQLLRQDVADDLEQLHDNVEEMVDKATSLFGYYECPTAAGAVTKTVTTEDYELTNGGNIRIKMEHANIAASNVMLQIGSATAKPLYYNGDPVTDENTWEDGETIVVYYDGTKYLATNSLGGGGNSALIDELAKDINGYYTDPSTMTVSWEDGYWSADGNGNDTDTRYAKCAVDIDEQIGSIIDIYATGTSTTGGIYIVKRGGTLSREGLSQVDVYGKHWQYTVQDDDDKLRVCNKTASLDSPYITLQAYEKGIKDEIEELKDGGESAASDISFDSLSSNLNSTTVQDAIDELDAQISGKIAPVENMTVSWIDGAWTDVNGNYHELTTYGRCEIDISNLTGSVIDIYARENNNIPAYVVKKNGTGINDDIICIDTTYLKHWQYTVQDDDDKLRVSNRYASVAEPYLTIIRYTQGIDDKLEALQDKVDGLEVGQASKEIDLIMFMGQSNMAGRGITSQTWPNDAPTVPDGFGYEFKSISDPTRLYGVTKTFGVNENVTGAINDGTSKTGGLVPAFINSYYKVCKTPIVGVSASIGGTSTAAWAVNGSLLNDAINRLGIAVSWLTDNGYTIRHKYMAWCQGETDGENANMTEEIYKTNFLGIFAAMQAEGIEKCFMIRIGEHNVNSGSDYTPIILAQNELCQENEDIVMVSTAFASMKARNLMKDEWHYYQEAYNQVGAQAGYWSAVYRQFHREGVMYDIKIDGLYYTQWSY